MICWLSPLAMIAVADILLDQSTHPLEVVQALQSMDCFLNASVANFAAVVHVFNELLLQLGVGNGDVALIEQGVVIGSK